MSPRDVVSANPGAIEPDLLTLASASPRRRILLATLDIPLQVVASRVSEIIDPSLDPAAQAIALAAQKAAAVAQEMDRGLVLGADTIVVLEQQILGKPVDDNDATRMLRLLSGREHLVITGVALVRSEGNGQYAAAVTTSVRFRPLSELEIARYVATGEPGDKAGAYAIQAKGRELVASFTGCFTNVVGLPLCETVSLLTAAGVQIPHDMAPACRLPNGDVCPRLV